MKILNLIAFSIIYSISTQTIEKYNKNKGYYCRGKLYDPFNNINKYELYDICIILNEDNNFLISVKNTIFLKRNIEKSIETHEKDTENMFYDNCVDFDGMCKNGLIISIYTMDKEIIIHVGDYVKDKVLIGDRNLVRLNIVKIVMRKNYLESIKIAIKMLRNYMNRSNVERNTIDRYSELFRVDEDIYIFLKIFFWILVIAFILLIIGLFLPDSILTYKPTLQNFLGFLINILEEINKCHQRKIKIEQCLICLKSLKNEIQVSKSESDFEDLILFDCKHVYHKRCQDSLMENRCVICFESIENNLSLTKELFLTEINEIQIHKLVRNIFLLYTTKEINDYYQIFPESSKILEKVFKIKKEDILSDNVENFNEYGDLAKKIK